MKEAYKEIHKMSKMCDRPKNSSCNFPGNDYADYMYNQSLKNNIGESESINDNDGNDIENFLEYDLSNVISLKSINSSLSYTEVV